jgi:hypothetical protein
MTKHYHQVISETCSKCPNFDYQWDSWGENGKAICLAVEIPPAEFVIDSDPEYHNGFRILHSDKSVQFNPPYWIPAWCPLPDGNRLQELEQELSDIREDQRNYAIERDLND